MAEFTKHLDEGQQAAWVAFLRAQRRILEQLEAELRTEHELSLSEFEVLLHLSGAPRTSLRMKELAANVLLTPSGLTRLADRMVRQGLIAREQCPNDRRGYFLTLTPAGQARFDAAAPTHFRGVEEHFARHLGDDAGAVAGALGRIAGT
jgi:DNA-binding MarR family transcriptional regulator